MYSHDNVLEEFYKALADEDEGRLRRVHIPRSDVYLSGRSCHVL